MTFTLLKILATIILFRILEFTSFFIFMATISCIQIYFVFRENKQFGINLAFKFFYIIIALAIIMDVELEILPASGLIIISLFGIFYVMAFINHRLFTTKIYIKQQKYNLFMIFASIICVGIAIFTRNHPTQIWIAPLTFGLCLIIKESIPDKFINRLVQIRG